MALQRLCVVDPIPLARDHPAGLSLSLSLSLYIYIYIHTCIHMYCCSSRAAQEWTSGVGRRPIETEDEMRAMLMLVALLVALVVVVVVVVVEVVVVVVVVVGHAHGNARLGVRGLRPQQHAGGDVQARRRLNILIHIVCMIPHACLTGSFVSSNRGPWQYMLHSIFGIS